MNKLKTKYDIKHNKSQSITNFQTNNKILDSSQESIKTFPKAFQEPKLASIKYTNSINDTPPTEVNQIPDFNNFNGPNLNFVHDYFNLENKLEDEHQSEEWLLKISIDEIVSLLFSLLALGNGIIYYEIRNCGSACEKFDSIKEDTIYATLLISSIVVLFYLFTMVFKYYHYFKLNQCAKYIQRGDNFFQSELWKSFLGELLMVVIHPNLLFRNKYCITGDDWNLVKVRYNINDFLIAISLFRMFDWVRVIVMQTQFSCARADRVCKMMGIKLSTMFSIKCSLIHNTMEMQCLISLIIITSLGYILKIIEGPVFEEGYPQSNNFTDLGGCIWFIFVTITTVGYGDYATQTLLGRIVVVFIGLLGTVLVALNINYFQSQTELGEDELRAVELIQRLEAKEELKIYSAKYFKSHVTYFLTKNQYLRGKIPDNEASKKRVLQLAKEKQKSKKKFNSLLHQFQVRYEVSLDVNLIKKKIGELDVYCKESTEKIVKIEKALTSLLNS